MRITFVALGWEQLGVSQLSAIAKRDGHTVQLAFSVALFNDRYNLSLPSIAPIFDDRNDVIAAIKKQQPDVIAFSVLTGTYQWMLGIAAEAKQIFPHVKTVFGGVHVSAVPERVLANPQVDFVCVGEGDVAFPAILRAIQQGGPSAPIVNTHFKLPDQTIVRGPQTGFIQDLDSLPIFDKEIWEDHINIEDWYLTMASRGCPYRCTFCFNNFFAELPEEKKGKYVRQRSVEHMMFELRQATKRYKIRMLEFEDDVFTVDKKWVKEFLDQYKREIRIPFQCLTHPKYIDDDVARWLHEAGCLYVQMGIQTMDDEYKFQTIKRYEKSAQVERAMEIMKRHKILPKVDHMFGLPGESIAAQEPARELYIKYPPYRIQTFWTNFLPGTEMVQQALAMGLMNGEDVERLNDGKGFDFYRSSSAVRDPQKNKAYKAYELIFKLIPFVPSFIRQRLDPRFFERLPVGLLSLLSFLSDLFYGLISRNTDHICYAKHYAFHCMWFFLRKLGLKKPSATRVRSAYSINLKVTKKANESDLQPMLK